MSLLKANSVQIGQSATATQNFTLSVPSSPDGTIKLARGNSGATTSDVLTVDASGNVTTTLANESIKYSQLSNSATEADNVAKRTAKAWVMFNGATLTAYSAQSYNISSIARIAGATSGGFRVSFTTAIPAANYSVLGAVGAGNEVWNSVGAACVRVVGATTGYVDFVTVAQNSNAINFGYTSIAILSS